MSVTTSPSMALPAASTRWIQMVLGLICMMAISSPQYVWTLFVKPLGTELNQAAYSMQITFSILIVLQTFFSPFQGWLIEKFGPRWLIAAGGAITGLSWVLASGVTSLWGLYLTYGLLGGIGTGIVYIGVVGQMVGWFPERRGFAVGIVAAGYGMGAMATSFPIADSLAAYGHKATLFQYGLIFGAIGVIAALGLRAPPPALLAQTRAQATGRDFTTSEMLKQPIFWLMFFMMSCMSTSGLMVTSQLAPMAADFGINKLMVWGFAAVPLALTIDRFCNGLTRPFFGWVSDRIGRENTMCLAFALEGVAMALWLLTSSNPVLFVLLSGVVFFGWGEIFSLFPSTLTDTFGAKFATKNYGCLYIAQGIGAIFGGPLASWMHDAVGSWTPVFAVAITADLLTAVLAIALLKPLRARFMARA